MFSEPTFVGVLQADANGNLLGNLPTPDLDPGFTPSSSRNCKQWR